MRSTTEEILNDKIQILSVFLISFCYCKHKPNLERGRDTKIYTRKENGQIFGKVSLYITGRITEISNRRKEG